MTAAPQTRGGDVMGRAVVARVRLTRARVIAAAGAVILTALVLGVAMGEGRIGVALGASLVMVLPWRRVGDARPARRSHAAGWRLVGIGVAIVSGGDALGELLGWSVGARIVPPGVIAAPILAVGLRWALARHRRVHRTFLDALLMAVGATLLAWQWVWQPLMGDHPTGWAVVVLGTGVGIAASLMLFSRGGRGLGAERLILCGAAAAFVVAAMLVDGTELIMRSWSAAFDGIGQVLAALAVVVGQRRAAAVAGGPPDWTAAVRWFPAAVAIVALLSTIWVGWPGDPDDVVTRCLQAALLFTLAGRVVQAGHDWRQAWRRLERAARVDDVTGLRNRTWLMASLPDQLRAGAIVAAIMLDIDRFKLVNDALGHHVGDQLLAILGARLHVLVPSGDVVRMGGDEFLVLVADTGTADPIMLAEQIRTAIASPMRVESHSLRPTVSIGMAFATPDITAEELLHDADSALYRAKEDGRDRVAVFDADMRRSAIRRLEIETGLRTAIDSDELSWVFQPIVDASTGAVTQLEALLRWDSPVQGADGAPEVLDVAELEGLIGPVPWVLDALCRAIDAVDSVPAWHGATVSFTVSTARLRHIDVVDDVEAALHRAGVDARRLVLEVPESAFLDPAGPEVSALRRVAALGVGVAVDGFGSGYSAFGYLPAMDLDILKLDPSFTGRLGTSQRPSLVGIIIDMAHRLGIRVIAGGVETDEQRQQLVAMGCDLLQGAAVGAAEPLTPAPPRPVA